MLSKVLLVNCLENVIIEANFVRITQKHATDYTSLWKELLISYKQRDKWWDWEFKLQSIINKQANREGYAIEYQGETEGLMMIETQMHGSQITPSKRLVYIDGLVSAPWNREEVQSPPKLKGVGSALLMFAQNRSIELGYEGRVGLHSLPGAEDFYESRSMMDLGPDEDYECMVYFLC
ncbi:MAG: GNAT family N-acetyltransferase [Scytonematopsis contorta HA4267-MV1]|jgi:hypothetical protein|nr:GNAT family N-acetyltransferase [Scytonematopsis contorta HA4267-MV1]